MIEFNTLFPLYVTDNLEAQIAFYTAVFGFEAVFFDTEFYLHLQHSGNGTQIGFLLPTHASQPEFLHAKALFEEQVISSDVGDAKAALAAPQRSELDIFFPYTKKPWGQNHFMLHDPSDFILDIVENAN
jgi:catechol 2,3-dioxygenase-like lactoylglutathione lyase family enzyme